MPSGALIVAVFEFVLLLFSLCVHECAHAWMASRLGDQTAREMGRVSLNPMDHIDPIGTLLFPALMIFGPLFGLNLFGGMLIGWAKPTPVITRNFRKLVRDDNLTTLAGPFSNLLIVFVAFVVLAIISLVVPDGRQYVYYAFNGSLLIDVSPGVHTVKISVDGEECPPVKVFVGLGVTSLLCNTRPRRRLAFFTLSAAATSIVVREEMEPPNGSGERVLAAGTVPMPKAYLRARSNRAFARCSWRYL